jgi:hypothetical protein
MRTTIAGQTQKKTHEIKSKNETPRSGAIHSQFILAWAALHHKRRGGYRADVRIHERGIGPVADLG